MRVTIKDQVVETDSSSLIDICYAHNMPINFRCRIGMCGICKIEVIEGLENLSKKTSNEKSFTKFPNERLACQCIVKGDIVIK